MLCSAVLTLSAQESVPDPIASYESPKSELTDALERFVEDRGSITRFYNIPTSAARRERMAEFYSGWRGELNRYDFDALSRDGQVDWLLFRNHVDRELAQLEISGERVAEAEPLVPFGARIVELAEARQRMEWIEPSAAATVLVELQEAVAETRKLVEAGLGEAEGQAAAARPKQTVAWRAAGMVDDYRRRLRSWFEFYNGYDPLFTWWAERPFGQADTALMQYADFLREKVVGIKRGEQEALIGDPIGREALTVELRYELIPYTPEQLIAIAEQEYRWCEAEMKRAAGELGYDDWHDALEHVKTLHVAPGEQPELIRSLAWEAIDFVESRELLTVPELAKHTWRMEMMSPERQLVSPFFLGGEVILVSYPTNTMTHEAKLMSMRGNNPHFARATVHHELIPGHHLQGFMTDRYRSYRRPLGTPFWTEGWALYWEMRLWDLEFPRSPEDRIGMLFWRMHRCARIVFSLNYHMENMTAEQAVDYLVEKVGHERANAEAEVRRSIAGGYGPLYQIAYMVGGLQFRALHRDLVGSGGMTDRQFHDAILRLNSMPVELVRASLVDEPLTRDFRSHWRFYGDVRP